MKMTITELYPAVQALHHADKLCNSYQGKHPANPQQRSRHFANTLIEKGINNVRHHNSHLRKRATR